jgi:hypothetical protein
MTRRYSEGRDSEGERERGERERGDTVTLLTNGLTKFTFKPA